ncbi:MAG: restriction endonuclease subunit R [Alphaproteobacteria bacterium]|nr:restriction endonuclease subunit R [Alphaproteobacteria bacterium]
MATFHPEDRARASIDERLAACGWRVQSRDEMNLAAGAGVAVRELATASGPVDYALFVDRRFCGVVEAKAAGATLSGFSDQAARYIADAPAFLGADPRQRRFEYIASETEILFRDLADPAPRSRRVFAFHRPETLRRWLSELETLRARLRRMPPLATEGLRACQVEAVEGLERSLAKDDPRALVQMTMGAGKTFTACTFSFRLLAHAGVRRILFLVDRRNLGNQTATEYAAYRPPGTGRLFPEIYGVQKLGAAGLDGDSAVVISTIQRVYSVLMGKDLPEDDEDASAFEQAEGVEKLVAYNPALPIETFDLVVTDECHRSIYGTWRQVLEYFDATIVGLTATPSAHTLGFFNRNLVAEYPYERSVVDGVNVGYEIYRIRTRIGEGGSSVDKGYTIPVRDKKTRAERYETLTDPLVYGKQDLDRSVIAPNQIRTVLETYRDTLPTELFPGREHVPKTLIFAKDDNHAEEIVMISREVFGKGNDFAKKITYRIDGADPEQLIKQFRNDYYPRVAVTVDMIATGTDVKPIEVLIFLRDVRSAGYFEQMKGRGVRSINPTDLKAVTPDAETKTRFVLIDAVGVTESKKTLAPPLDRDRAVAFSTLLDRVAAGDRRDDTLSTLAARLAALDRRIEPEARADLARLAGGPTLAEIANALIDAIDPDTIERAVRDRPAASPGALEASLKDRACAPFDDPKFRAGLEAAKAAADVKIDVISTDEVISSGYDETRAQAVADRFREFLEEHRDSLAALQIFYGRPYAQRRLTYEALEELRDALRQPPWLLEPVNIWRAYKRLNDARVRGSSTRILTDVVMLVRYALGLDETLEPLPAKAAARFNLWLGREKNVGRDYTEEQLAWLTAIRDHLAVNAEVSRRDLQDTAAFADKGGTVRAGRLFAGRLDDILDDLTDTLVA